MSWSIWVSCWADEAIVWSEICFRLSGFYGSPFWSELNGFVWNNRSNSARAPTTIHNDCVCMPFKTLHFCKERVQDDDEVLFLEIQWNGKEFTWSSRSCNGFHWRRSDFIHIHTYYPNRRPVYSAGERWPSHSFGSGSGKPPTDLPRAYSAYHRTLISRNCCIIRGIVRLYVVMMMMEDANKMFLNLYLLWNTLTHH